MSEAQPDLPGVSEPAAPAAPAAPTAPAPSVGVGWHSSIPEEMRGNPALSSFTDDAAGIAALAKEHIGVQTLIGRDKVARPPEGSTAETHPEEWDRYYNSLGRPETIDGYDTSGFKPPEGLPWDEKCLRFHESKREVLTISRDQVNKPIYRSAIGRWLAYVTNETGRHEVCVGPFPSVDDGKWPVSLSGGAQPQWGRSSGGGREGVLSRGDVRMGVDGGGR